jgi:hypothetical protein
VKENEEIKEDIKIKEVEENKEIKEEIENGEIKEDKKANDEDIKENNIEEDKQIIEENILNNGAEEAIEKKIEENIMDINTKKESEFEENKMYSLVDKLSNLQKLIEKEISKRKLCK